MDKSTKNRVLIIVSGGVADYICDPGINVEIFDWDNYDHETKEGRAAMALQTDFADLACPFNIPTKAE